MSHFVIKLSHFVTPCLGDRMQDFSVHAGNEYLPKVKNPFGFNRPGEKIYSFFLRKNTNEMAGKSRKGVTRKGLGTSAWHFSSLLSIKKVYHPTAM